MNMKQIINLLTSSHFITSIGVFGFVVASMLYPHLVIILLSVFIYTFFNLHKRIEK